MLWWPHMNKETVESSFFFSFSKNWLFYCSSVLFCCPCKALSKVDFEKCSINKDYDYYTINVCLSHYILVKACIRHTLTAWIQSLSLMHLSVQQVEQAESTSCQLIRSPSADYWALMVLSETTGVSAKKQKKIGGSSWQEGWNVIAHCSGQMTLSYTPTWQLETR